jgi:hypothetical protein
VLTRVTLAVLLAATAVQAQPAQAPPSWWSRFEAQCAAVLNPAALDQPAQMAVAATGLLVAWLVYQWIALLGARLPAVCASVHVDGTAVKDARAIWIDARGRIERTMIDGFAAIHDAGARNAASVAGRLTVTWEDPAATGTTTQTLTLAIDEPASKRRWLRRAFGGRNIVTELPLSLVARDLRLADQPALTFSWKRPALPPQLDAAATEVRFAYRIQLTYTVAGDHTLRPLALSTLSSAEAVSVALPATLQPVSIPEWSVETSLAGAARSVRASSGWVSGATP